MDYVLNKFRLVGFFGQRGSAKTAMATYFIRLLQNSLGLPVVANYNLKLPDARKLDVSELVSNEFTDTIIGCDEIYSQADSRLSLSMQNIYYSYFISQIRKGAHSKGGRGLGNFVVYTAQLQSMADLRVFEQTSLYVMMEQFPSGDFGMEWVNQEGEEGGGVVPFEFVLRECVPYFDTDEKIMPLAKDSMQVEMERFNPVKYNVRINDVVEAFLKENSFRSFKDVQRFSVADFLRKKGIPEKLTVAVFDRVRERVRLQST